VAVVVEAVGQQLAALSSDLVAFHLADNLVGNNRDRDQQPVACAAGNNIVVERNCSES